MAYQQRKEFGGSTGTESDDGAAADPSAKGLLQGGAGTEYWLAAVHHYKYYQSADRLRDRDGDRDH